MQRAFCAKRKYFYMFEKQQAASRRIGRNAVKFASKMEIISFQQRKKQKQLHETFIYQLHIERPHKTSPKRTHAETVASQSQKNIHKRSKINCHIIVQLIYVVLSFNNRFAINNFVGNCGNICPDRSLQEHFFNHQRRCEVLEARSKQITRSAD